MFQRKGQGYKELAHPFCELKWELEFLFLTYFTTALKRQSEKHLVMSGQGKNGLAPVRDFCRPSTIQSTHSLSVRNGETETSKSQTAFCASVHQTETHYLLVAEWERYIFNRTYNVCFWGSFITSIIFIVSNGHGARTITRVYLEMVLEFSQFPLRYALSLLMIFALSPYKLIEWDGGGQSIKDLLGGRTLWVSLSHANVSEDMMNEKYFSHLINSGVTGSEVGFLWARPCVFEFRFHSLPAVHCQTMT